MALGPDAGDWFRMVPLHAMVGNRHQPTIKNASVGFNWFGLGTCQLFQWFQSETNGGTCCARIILCSSKSLQVSIVHVPFCFCGLYSSDLLVKHWLLRRVWSGVCSCFRMQKFVAG